MIEDWVLEKGLFGSVLELNPTHNSIQEGSNLIHPICLILELLHLLADYADTSSSNALTIAESAADSKLLGRRDPGGAS
ncbi:hypothetical protein RYX36_005411 [Vicia faba]